MKRLWVVLDRRVKKADVENMFSRSLIPINKMYDFEDAALNAKYTTETVWELHLEAVKK